MIIAIGDSLSAAEVGMSRRVLAVLAAPLFLSMAIGCAPDPAVPTGAPPIARVWASRCGACHSPVEPGTRTKSHLEDALARHKNRVPLSDAEWSEMRAFLAGSSVETATASQSKAVGEAR
jgi:hypothetical protein